MIPYLGILGLRGLRSAFTIITYAKIENRLVPPLNWLACELLAELFALHNIFRGSSHLIWIKLYNIRA